MGKRALLVFAVAAGLALTSAPARSQLSAFEFPLPVSTRAVGGKYLVRWDDRFVSPLDTGLYSISWYYSATGRQEDRKRLMTTFRDDFSNGFRANWTPQGQFIFDWDVRQERGGDRRFLVAPKMAGPVLSKDGFPANMVVSVLVRPVGIKPEFSLAVNVQPNGRGYEVQNVGDTIRVMQNGRQLANGQQRLLRVGPGEWYWYEIGILSKHRSKEVEIRVRVFDEKHEKLLVQFPPMYDRPPMGIERGGLIQLTGPAHFAEINVDPWASRWADSRKNELIWNTEAVPDGDYHIIAEVHDGKKQPQTFVSEYKVEVRNRAVAAAGNE